MYDETLYYTALERLSYITDGFSDFQKICLKFIKFKYPNYDFNPPEGGKGTKDGGYDGRDTIKRAKLACSLEKNFEKKIKSEIEKSRANSDQIIFYLSNQVIPEPDKNRIKADPASKGIELNIFGIDSLSRELSEYLHNHYDPELYDLLGLSFLKNGERYKRGDAIPLDINFNGNIYKKKVYIINKSQYSYLNENAIEIISENPLLDYIIDICSEKKCLQLEILHYVV